MLALSNYSVAMQEEWQFLLGPHLHLEYRPLFVLGCKYRSMNDWACSKFWNCNFVLEPCDEVDYGGFYEFVLVIMLGRQAYDVLFRR